jgi:hypothetical protein
MDRLENYRNAVKTFLKQYADTINQCPQPGVEVELVAGVLSYASTTHRQRR